MPQLTIKAAATAARWLTRIVAALAMVFILCAFGLHWVIVPRIDDFRPRLQAMASQALGAPVRIGALRAESNGLVPAISLHDVQVLDASGRAGLRVPRVLAAFSVLSLASGGLEQLVIEQPELEVRRSADGRLLVAGLDLSGDAAGDTGAADWFFSQEEFVVLGGQVRWVDEARGLAPVALHNVQLVMRNGRHRHQMRLDATPDAPWGGLPFTLIGRFRQPLLSAHPGQWQHWEGQVFAHFQRVDVSRLRHYADLKTDWGIDLRQGRGALRLWADLRRARLVGATADVALGAVEVALGEGLEPLAFSRFTGRLGWRDEHGRMALRTEGLQFTDADGLNWPGGNLQLRLGQTPQGGGELDADQLDLAVLAKIASRLPLPPIVHQRLRQHPVQGRVDKLAARWQGALDAPADWHLSASLSAVSVGTPASAQTVGIPGVQGAALRLSATPAGGRASLAIRNGALSFPGLFEEPRIPLADLSLRAQWRVQGRQIALDVDELKLHNDDASGSFKAAWRTYSAAEAAAAGGSPFPGVLDLQGRFARANGARVHRYLPLVVPAQARHYVRDAIRKGQARDVDVHVKGDLRRVADNPPQPGSAFRFAGQVSGVVMAYVPRALQPPGQPPWPPLEELAGELVFDQSAMRVNKASARVQGHPGWRFTQIQAGIDDLAHARVKVDGLGSGPLAAALGIVRASPVAGFTEHALDEAQASGDARLHLQLDLPIEQIAQSKVAGLVTLPGNDLRMTPDTPLLTGAQGNVRFSDTGFALQELRVHLLGGQAQVSGGMDSPAADVVVRARGTATAEGLRQMHDWAPLPGLARRASGSASYEARLSFGSQSRTLLVTSDLQGMAFDLPAPLDKPAAAAWALRYEMQAPHPGQDRLRLRVADQLAFAYERDTSGPTARVRRGALAIGAQAVQAMQAQGLPERGIQARVQLPRLHVESWASALKGVFDQEAPPAPGAPPAPAQAAASNTFANATATPAAARPANAAASAASAATAARLAQAGPPPLPVQPAQPASAAAAAESGYLPTAWTLQADELQADGRTLHAVRAQATRRQRHWQAEVQARELAGRIEYDESHGADAGRVRARLARLSIPASQGSAGDGPQPAPDEPPSRIPALDVVVDNFELRGRHLGQLQVQAVNHSAGQGGGPQWQLSRLMLTTPEASLSASGRWAPSGPEAGQAAPPALHHSPRPVARRTALDWRLDIRDAGALLARFDMPGVIAQGRGHIQGSLAWAGAPFSPHYPSMDGQLHLAITRGQLLKADPGIAKLLGVLSLQSLPRRLTLDFRDLFSTGFAFDAIDGDVRLQRGSAHTRNLRMQGPSAVVMMEGAADLSRETQDLRVVVVPEIDAGGAALVATAFNPVVGLSAFLAQLVLQKPLAQAATREFHIGGTWLAPQVTPVARGAAAPARAASAAASNAPFSGAPSSNTPDSPAAPASPPSAPSAMDAADATEATPPAATTAPQPGAPGQPGTSGAAGAADASGAAAARAAANAAPAAPRLPAASAAPQPPDDSASDSSAIPAIPAVTPAPASPAPDTPALP